MRKAIQLIAIAAFAQASLIVESTEAMPVGFPRTSIGRAGTFIQETALIVRRGGYVGRRGGFAYRRTTVVRPGWHGGGVRWGGGARWGRWARPARYWWPAGGAIAAGAAIGFVSAASAAAWAGAAPGPNMCWYYTDPSRTNGFWDGCQ